MGIGRFPVVFLVVLDHGCSSARAATTRFLSDDGEVSSGFLEVLVIIASMGLPVSGSASGSAHRVRRRNDARFVR